MRSYHFLFSRNSFTNLHFECVENRESANGRFLEEQFSLDADDDDLEEAELLSGKWAVVIRSSTCNVGALAGQLSNVRLGTNFW